MYSLERILHHFNLSHPYRKPTGFEALALNYGISQVASGMLAMFGVLFVYELGESFGKGLLMVLLFFGLQRVVVGLATPLAGKLIAKTGYRWMMFVGLISLALKAWLLMQVSRTSLWLLVPALILGGIAIASYYLGYHGLFLDDNDDDKIGQQMGLLTMAGRLALMVSPILAGFLVDSYGFRMMFGVAMSLLVVSLGPLFLMDKHEHRKNSFSIKKAVKLAVRQGGFSKSVFWWHVENAIQSFYWPVFLWLLVGSHVEFGEIVSLAMIVNSLAVYAAGRIYDKRPLRRAQPLATGLVVIGNSLRYLSSSVLMAVSVDGANRAVNPFWWMKIRRKALLVGEKVRAVVFAVAWEWLVTLGYLTGLIMGYLIIDGVGWRWLAVPAGLGAVMASWSLRKYE